MQPSDPMTPLRFSFLALHRQLEALGRWALHQDDPQPTLTQNQAQLDAQQVALWDLLLPKLKADDNPMALLGLVMLQLGLRQAGRQLTQLGQMITQRKVIKPMRKRLPQVFTPLQRLLAALETGLERQLTGHELADALSRLQPPIEQLHTLLNKRLKTGQNLPILLHQARLLWQLERLDDPLTQAIEGLMTWQLGSPQRIEAARLLGELAEQLPTPLKLSPIPHTRSGALVHHLEGVEAILKQGDARKLAGEHRNLKHWQARWPQLVPQVLGFENEGDQAALMLSQARGQTLAHWLLQPDPHLFEAALRALLAELAKLWQHHDDTPAAPPRHMAQLRQRLKAVWQVHPEFRTAPQRIAGHPWPTLEQLISRAARLEKHLPLVHTVPLHGDLNLDNILYDAETGQITLVDLNRATTGDYSQDMSTLMVSFYRTPNYQPAVRQRIVWAMDTLLRFTRRQGGQLHDPAIDARLGFGLARGLITSTRFIFEPWHARTLFDRGQLLLSQLARLKPQQLHTWRLSKELFHAKP